MRLSARLTLDGLVRALRVRAHRLADEVEEGYAQRADRAVASRSASAERRSGTGADDDDVSGD